MAEPNKPVGPSIIQRVFKAASRERLDQDRLVTSGGAPGHLLQLTTAGRAMLEVNGRRYEASPGMLIWSYENENTRRVVHEVPWRYHVVNFIAPALSPPPFELRMRQVGPSVQRSFEELVRTWKDSSASPAIREMRVHVALLNLLLGVSGGIGEPFHTDPSAHLWWDLEQQVRKNLARRLQLADLEAMSGRSVATITRSCVAAVGETPIKRIKHIRLSVARGLVWYSDLQMKEIAARVGYPRVHELSRDYHKHFGLSPRRDRAQGAARQGVREVNR